MTLVGGREDGPTDALAAALDARLAAGISHQRTLLQDATAAGATVLGWKAGLGAPTLRTSLGLSAPLIGFLFDTSRVRPGTTVDVAAWTAPRAEAEVAVRIGVDVPGHASASEALAAVDALGPAIELVDLAPPPRDPVEVLAGNIYHRVWLTGPFVATDGAMTLHDRRMSVTTTHGDPVVVGTLEALTGATGDVLTEVARMAGRIGRGLRAGDVVMLGSVVPPHPVAPGDRFEVTLDDAATVTVSLR